MITAMVTGRKPVLDYADQQEAHLSPVWRAAACAVVAVALVVGGVMLGGRLGASLTLLDASVIQRDGQQAGDLVLVLARREAPKQPSA